MHFPLDQKIDFLLWFYLLHRLLHVVMDSSKSLNASSCMGLAHSGLSCGATSKNPYTLDAINSTNHEILSSVDILDVRYMQV